MVCPHSVFDCFARCADKDFRCLRIDCVAASAGAEAFHCNERFISRQKAAVIIRHECPESSSRVARLGECRLRCNRNAFERLMSLPSRARGVYNEIKPLSDVVSARTSCAEKSRCAGVAFRFQVIENSVEPREAIAASNQTTGRR
jgi:hypothetical protein